MSSVKLKIIWICSIVWFSLSGMIILAASYWDNGLFFVGGLFSIIGALLLINLVSTEEQKAKRTHLRQVRQNGVDDAPRNH